MESKKPGLFSRFAQFCREVVIESKKVVWPSRNDLYGSIVVLIFVGFVLTFVLGVIDWAIGSVLMGFLTKGSGQ